MANGRIKIVHASSLFAFSPCIVYCVNTLSVILSRHVGLKTGALIGYGDMYDLHMKKLVV
jgi:hypothetical protein